MTEQTVEILVAVIGSSVIASIITSIITLHTSSKQASLEYITKERSRWREEIRAIAVEIAECKSSRRGDLLKVLTKLKVRINVHGLEDNASDRSDKYLWKRIRKVEGIYGRVGDQNLIDWDKLEEELDGLINDLSKLLKDDWEHSKKEVSLWYRLTSWMKSNTVPCTIKQAFWQLWTV